MKRVNRRCQKFDLGLDAKIKLNGYEASCVCSVAPAGPSFGFRGRSQIGFGVLPLTPRVAPAVVLPWAAPAEQRGPVYASRRPNVGGQTVLYRSHGIPL